MYSVNLNQEDEKKRMGKQSSLFSGNEDFSAVPEANYFEQEPDDNGVVKHPSFNGNSYGKDDIFNNTIFASSMQERERETPAPSVFSAPDGAIPNDDGHFEMSSAANVAADAKDETRPFTSARELLGAGYKKNRFLNDSYKTIFPENTPQRNKFLYSVSPKALDDVATDYFNNELSELYNKKLDEARVYSNKAFSEYYQNPVAASRIAKERHDPIKIADETIKEIDTEKLRQMVEPLARRGGFDADKYIEDYVKPTLHNMMLADYVDKNKPKNSTEYILRSAYNNSLIGKAANIGFSDKSSALIENESLAKYDAGKLENFAAGIGSLLIDAPAFAAFGSLAGNLTGNVTKMATNRLGKKLLATNDITKEQAARLAERAIKSRLSTKIAESAATQGLTLGTYDLANSVADDVLYNEGVDVGKAAGAFAKGLATGGAVGAVGTRLKKAMGGLTGGKKMLASTGVLSAESAVFTLSTEIDKVLNDVDIEPIDLVNDFAESAATLGVMKMAHWRPAGVKNKLKADGTLKDELKLSKTEQAELREINIDPVEFMKELETTLALPSYGIGATRKAITERYTEMMQSKELSAATKSKLMYLIENKLTSTPPVAFDYNVEQNRNGEWLFTTYDFVGNKVESRAFESPESLKSHLLVNKGKLRKNRIAAYEHELLQGVNSQNLLRQAGLYGKEKNVSIDAISQALYKRAQNIPLAGWEDILVREIVERASYDQNGMVQFLADMRRNIEQKHGLDDGSLLTKINEQFYKCSKAENNALDEYEALVRNEVNSLKQGTDKKRAAEFRELGKNSAFKGMTNDEVKSKEVADFYTLHPEKNQAVGSVINMRPIKIDDNKPSAFVWSYNGVENTTEDIKHLSSVASRLAEKLNFKVDFINNEREIPYPDVNNERDVANYNNKLRAMGWLDRDGKITINLPNVPSVEDVEKTVVHEGVTHLGLLKLFGNHLNNFLEEIYRKASSSVRSDIANIQSRYPFADNFTVIEEYLAHLSEKAVLSPSERSMLTNFKDFVKNSLIRLNVYTGRNRRITEAELNSLLRQHAKYIEKRTPPSKYRRWVFGNFDAAKQNENSYYDRQAYEDDVRAKIAEGKYFTNTPVALYNTKLLQNYEFLPENKKQQVLKQWGMTDEQVMQLKSQDKFRFVGKKGADNKAFYEGYEDGDPELAQAIEFEKKGVNSNDIRFATGWQRGVDKQWRKEMPDGKMMVHDQLYKTLVGKNKELALDYLDLKKIPLDAWGHDEKIIWERVQRESGDLLKNGNLGDVLHDPSFYATYPELANLPVEIVNNTNVPLRYDSRNKKILIDKSFFLYPENSVYMSGVLQNVIQDYEGFSKAVSMNVFGINSKLGRKYREAQKIIEAINNARSVVPDFDKNRDIDKAFEKEYKFTPEDFKKRFPSLEEYMIYKLTGKDIAFSGDVEVRNVMNRFDAGEFDGRVISPEVTEDIPRSKQVAIKELSDLKKYFNGPLDIIFQKIQQLHSDEPLILENVKKRVRRADLSPLERGRFEWEMEEYAKEVLERLQNMGKWKNDYGYGKFKKREEKKKRLLNDAVELQKWRGLYEHYEDGLEELN